MTISPEITVQTNIREQLTELTIAYNEASDESQKRRIDWEIRCKAHESNDLDDETKYLRVTYGADTHEAAYAKEQIEAYKLLTGQLFFIPPGNGSYNYGYMGKFPDIELYVGEGLYAFDNLPLSEDQQGLCSGIVFEGRALEIGRYLSSYYSKEGPFYSLDHSSEPTPFYLSVRHREAIVPHPVPYSENPEGLVFNQPINYYDVTEPRFEGNRKTTDGFSEIILGKEKIEEWFNAYTRGSYFDEYMKLIESAQK